MLFELEDKIAQAAADVQNAQSEVWGAKEIHFELKKKRKKSEDFVQAWLAF